MREKAGVERLTVRRETLCKKFAEKAVKNERFSARWFPVKDTNENTPVLRKTSSRKYVEYNARTERRYNSPLFFMRRLLNR
jgi:hypothetical protein